MNAFEVASEDRFEVFSGVKSLNWFSSRHESNLGFGMNYRQKLIHIFWYDEILETNHLWDFSAGTASEPCLTEYGILELIISSPFPTASLISKTLS